MTQRFDKYIETEIIETFGGGKPYKVDRTPLSEQMWDDIPIDDRVKEASKEIALQQKKEAQALAEKEATLERYHKAKAFVARVETELDLVHVPAWDYPHTWEMMPVSDLGRGDGLTYQNIICIYVKKFAWWRSKTANVLIQEANNPAKYYRIGECDYVKAFKGYVTAQRMAKWEKFLED